MELLKLEKEGNVLFRQEYCPTHEDFFKNLFVIIQNVS